jgi:hypothetical protein
MEEGIEHSSKLGPIEGSIEKVNKVKTCRNIIEGSSNGD